MKKKKEGKNSRVMSKTQNIYIEARKEVEEKNKGNYQYLTMNKERKEAEQNIQKQI